MADSLSDLFISLLNINPLSRLRRNHGLEHATLHVLSQRHPGKSMAGHSDLTGFWILGDLSADEVQSAVLEALERLHSGERHLAVHPNCGTNFATAGIFAGILGSAAMLGVGRRFRDKLERIPLAIMLATVALMLAQPLGLLLQERVTTSGEPEGLEVVKIIPIQKGKITLHRILTQD